MTLAASVQVVVSAYLKRTDRATMMQRAIITAQSITSLRALLTDRSLSAAFRPARPVKLSGDALREAFIDALLRGRRITFSGKSHRMHCFCHRCGGLFETHASEIRRRCGMFCDRACWALWKREQAIDPRAISERFWKQVVKSSAPPHKPQLGSCYEWRGRSKVNTGYGTVRFGDRSRLAHRVSFYLHEGRWPEPQALHHCDNRLCVRRSHLFEGTQADNMLDMASKGRGRKKGNRQP